MCGGSFCYRFRFWSWSRLGHSFFSFNSMYLLYLCMYVCMYVVCWVVMSEIMSTRLRSKAMSLFLSINWACNLLIG